MNQPFQAVTRRILEAREDAWLCAPATRASQSLGRRYKDDRPTEFRTCFQHDKDRIIHSTAFRRLEYKTQVFVNHEGDHYRTRLTHTLEVVQIARAIARTLRLNEDLAEAVALGHDMGHTPFGHAGERILNELMRDHGGFEHNAQALRIVDVLEDRYPGIPGLNLSAEVRAGLLKNRPPYPGEGEGIAPKIPIEACVSDIADEIAYNSHDCDDGLESGLLTSEALRDVRIWREVEDEVRLARPEIDSKMLRYATVRALIDKQVQDVVAETLKRIEAATDDTEILPGFSDAMSEKNVELKRFLRSELYQHSRVVAAMSRSVAIIERLFATFLKDPSKLPGAYRSRIDNVGPERAVSDYIAGMTDRYAESMDLVRLLE